MVSGTSGAGGGAAAGGNLTDRQAAGRVRENLSWKYALGLEPADPGFDHSVLAEFRTRVVEHGLEERALDLLLTRLAALGLLGAGGRQRTDSTHIVAVVREPNRRELAGESVRAALEALSAAAPHRSPRSWTPPGRAGTPPASTPGACRRRRRRRTRSPWTTPSTGTRCWAPSTIRVPRPGCASCPRYRLCASC
ncbi:transposase [Streptomyces sp. NPDC057910]|uniref:transposase n=1 Tax=Streptomyces sp. NPDC057910 TaxID=3346278 RepID=UPI0036EE3B2E